MNVGTTELIFFPRRRFQPDIGSLAASAGLVSILNADIETFVDPEDLPSYLRRVEDGVVSSYEVDGHAVEFIRQLNAYSTPADRGQMPLGVFGVRALDSTELAGIRSFATHAMRQASARVNTRSRSESLTRMVYEHIATPDFQADLVNN